VSYASHRTECIRPCAYRVPMPTTAPRPDAARRRAETEAWRAYQDELRDLDGRDYEDTEGLAWARLQLRLDEIARAHRRPEQ
jgi:hypothetical protein